MTIINGSMLLAAAPLSPMLATKERAHGTSFGLAEAGDYGNGKYQGQADRPVAAILEG